VTLSHVSGTAATAAICYCWFAAGQPLRPALLWMDMRSAAQAAQVAATGDIALQVHAVTTEPDICF
jgi:sugar (pentulose or hexulose) kinase